jgi:hypothetical protein
MERQVERAAFELNLVIRAARIAGVRVWIDLVDRRDGTTEVLVRTAP